MLGYAITIDNEVFIFADYFKAKEFSENVNKKIEIIDLNKGREK